MGLSLRTKSEVFFKFLNFLAGVDFQYAKLCELGLLNYKTKHVFYPFEKKKFRCRYDYYWASIFEVILTSTFFILHYYKKWNSDVIHFQVEYTYHSSYPHIAFAEAPNEALPPNCRPTINTA